MKPTHFVAVFDSPPPLFRNDIYSEYKANRGAPPEDLIPQFDISFDLCFHAGIPSYRCRRYEADDIIATLCFHARKQGLPVRVVTIDKDINQLVTNEFPTVQRVDIGKEKVFDRDAVFDSMGVYPSQVQDFQSLVGDSVDNIPGVAGIGKKTASILMMFFGFEAYV